MVLGKHLVYSRLPSILSGRATNIRLPGYELWLTFIKNVHFVPAVLDVRRFEEALSGTLRFYPHAAGRLRRQGDEWNVELTDSPIPVDIEESDTSQNLFDDDWVVRDDISPWLNPQPRDVELVNGDAPLLRVKLTRSRNETAIGISWHHTLGDASVLLRFLKALSQTYQDPPFVCSEPSFDKYEFPTAREETVRECLPLMPHLQRTYPMSELGQQYAEANRGVSRINLRLEPHHQKHLRAMIAPDVIAASHISTQDCITAYIVRVLNQCKEDGIRTVTNAASYRGVKALFVDPNVAGNAIYIVKSADLGTKNTQSMSNIAASIRKSIQDARNPHFIKNWMAVASHRMLRAANAGESLFFAPESTTLTVNSNTALNWRSVHFGFPGRARFYTMGTSMQYLRTFRANPRDHPKGEGGKDTPRCNPSAGPSGREIVDALDVSFGVPFESKTRVVDRIKADFSDLKIV